MNNTTYYHFLTAENAKKDLKNQWIKVATLGKLNDPHELMPYTRFKDIKERRPYEKVFNEVSEEWGLLCFSKSKEGMLLWASYADKHKGVALGFEIKDKIIEVEYTDEKQRRKIDLIYTDKDKKEFLKLAGLKHEQWEYEQEVRILVKLDECDTGKVENGKEIHFLKFENRLELKEIVFGCFFDRGKRAEIMKFGKQINPNIDVSARRKGFQGYNLPECGRWTDYNRRLLKSL